MVIDLDHPLLASSPSARGPTKQIRLARVQGRVRCLPTSALPHLLLGLCNKNSFHVFFSGYPHFPTTIATRTHTRSSNAGALGYLRTLNGLPQIAPGHLRPPSHVRVWTSDLIYADVQVHTQGPLGHLQTPKRSAPSCSWTSEAPVKCPCLDI